MKEKQTILCSAFPATGKTYFFNNSNKTVLDSDSSKFNKNDFPDNYIKHIKFNLGKADIIFISSHEEVRNALVDNNLEFTLVYPDISLKNEYLKRYKQRGNVNSFVNLLNDNWNEWINQLQNQDGCKKIVLKSNEFISDVI